MTVRQLMNHTSGLTYGFFSNTPVDKMYQKTQPLYSQNNQIMIEKLSEIPLLYPPNQKWHYSIATDVLGHLVEKISKQALGTFFERRIFEPGSWRDRETASRPALIRPVRGERIAGNAGRRRNAAWHAAVAPHKPDGHSAPST